MKRLFDILVSLTVLTILSPLLVFVSILIKSTMGSPILFQQSRPGKEEKIFKILKFRTMTDIKNNSGSLLPDNKRLTKLGVFLRKTSIDELPEFLNVLKGDMSLVGPRPLLVKYLPYYTNREKKRHSVLPGITGLAQVSGRNFLDWDKRLELDVKYVETMNFWSDLKILYKTIFLVFISKDVSVNSNIVESSFDEYRKNKT